MLRSAIPHGVVLPLVDEGTEETVVPVVVPTVVPTVAETLTGLAANGPSEEEPGSRRTDPLRLRRWRG